MKIRTGFVSNSSSSSFICDITGQEECGFDISYKEAGYCICVNKHVFVDHYRIEIDDNIKKKVLKRNNIYYEGNDDLDTLLYKVTEEYYVLEEECPICMLKEFKRADLIKYLLSGRTEKEVMEEVKKRYKSYDIFIKSLTP